MRFRALAQVASAAILSLSIATVASAQATRTWVSGVGDDVNPCSRTAPCKTFAGAISKTAGGGEISVLDPGGFGAVTITKSITLDGGGGQVASILSSGFTGILINAQNTDVVQIRNLRINGAQGGLNGIRILNAKAVKIENCDITNFTGNPGRGVSIELNSATAAAVTTVMIDHCWFFNNAGTHVLVAPAGGQPVVNLDVANSNLSFSTGNSGVFVLDGGKATVRNCEITNNANAGVQGDGSVVPAQVLIDDSNISFNSIGVGAGGTATVSLSNTTILGSTANGLGLLGGSIFTFGTNRIVGNAGNNGTGMTAVTPSIPASQK
jgi:hypothetical protein